MVIWLYGTCFFALDEGLREESWLLMGRVRGLLADQPGARSLDLCHIDRLRCVAYALFEAMSSIASPPELLPAGPSMSFRLTPCGPGRGAEGPAGPAGRGPPCCARRALGREVRSRYSDSILLDILAFELREKRIVSAHDGLMHGTQYVSLTSLQLPRCQWLPRSPAASADRSC